MSGALPLQGFESVAHGANLLGRVADPVEELADNAQWLATAEGLRRIPGELLVGQVGVVLELAARFDDVYAPAPLTGSEFGAPHSGVEGRREVDVRHDPVVLEVRGATGHED